MTALALESLWSATAPPGPQCVPLRGAQQAEVAIIGAGYTGLSAALHLAQAGRAVVVLEACDLGAGASGLNGGQVIAGLKHDPDELEGLLGASLGRAVIDTVSAAPDVVFDLVERFNIPCEARRVGWIQPAVSAATLEAQNSRARQWQERGAAVEMLSREDVQRLTGTDRYCGGLLDRRGGSVQPLAYLRGLAHAALAQGTQLYSRSPATRLTRNGDTYRIETPDGSLSAPWVIVATNAYTGALTETLRRSVVAVPSFQVATAPLSAQLRAGILPQGQAASDTCRLLRYFRLDASGRFVMGTRGSYTRTPTTFTVRHHYRAVRELYPQLARVAFEYHWGGYVALTKDHLPHLHQLAPGLLAGLGYNGRGVAMATVMGRLLARWVLGEAPGTLGFPVTPVRPLPLHAFSRLGVRVAVQYLRLADAWTRSHS
ncbi:MAG TPA: FAD-binding oxidoreductase [Steroidobacteraceae bacterium]|nr:FAD-binding oxidoreductase [Steroidobacteraceae bacterium]